MVLSSASTTALAVCGGYAGLCALSWLFTALTAPGFRVAGKHVFITGGSSGLGLALATQYARAGAKVTIVARDEARLAAAKQTIEASARSGVPSHAVCAIVCDVGTYGAVERAVAEANAFHARVTDHVICNAGVVHPGLLLEQDVVVFRRMMETNFFGTLHTVKAALPHMVRTPLSAGEPRRRVVFVSSAAGLMTFVGYAQYSSSKFAVRGLSDALRNELLLYEIDTTAYYPGNIATPMHAEELPLMPEEARLINGTSGAATPDDAARTLIRGIARGEYAVTNEPILHVLRTLANGVAPRANTPVEMLLLPLLVVIQTVYLFFMDLQVKQAAKRRKQDTK